MSYKIVLIVDEDNQDVARMIGRIMSQLGEYPVVAKTNLEALGMLEPSGLAVNVLIAGGRKGLDLLIRVKMNPNLAHIRLVSTSGYDLSDTAEKIGAKFIGKPFSANDLKEVL